MLNQFLAWIRNADAQASLPLPRKATPFGFGHLTPHGLRSLACLDGVQLTSSCHRETLLAFAEDKAQPKTD